MLRPLLAACCGIALLPSGFAQVTTRVSVNSSGFQGDLDSSDAALSSDGRFIAFLSRASNLVAGDANLKRDVFVRDQLYGQTTLVSVSTSGVQANGNSSAVSICGDGARIVFLSAATNLLASPAPANMIYLRESAPGQTTLVSVGSGGAPANADCKDPAISADGRYVAFVSSASNLVAGDTNGIEDVFVRDLASGTTVRASVDSGGAQVFGRYSAPSLSADGRFVAFVSDSIGLVPGDNGIYDDVFVHDMQTHANVRASIGWSGLQPTGDSSLPHLSADGSVVAFTSTANDLVPVDLNSFTDVFVRDLHAGTTDLASVDSSGAASIGNAFGNSISGDGRLVAFDSEAPGLVGGDGNGVRDVFVHDRVSGATWRASVSSAGGQAGLPSQRPQISADGRVVCFDSLYAGFVSGDTNNELDVFARWVPASVEAFCFGDGPQATSCPCANYGFPGSGCDNSAGTGGAVLAANGIGYPDGIVLHSTGELSTSLSIFLQGDAELNPGTWFGDGVRCVGGALKRLYAKSAVNGSVSAPGAGDLGIRARSAQLGDTIPIGATRSYQVYYRDPDATFCTPPFGNTWNVTNGVRVHW